MTVTEDAYRNPIADPYSWKFDIVDQPAAHDPQIRIFEAATDPMNEGRSLARVICRGTTLAVYARTFADGSGERPIHSHDDESCWYVVHGGARFYDGENSEIASVSEGHGVFIPPGARYRFECFGPETLLLRIASRCPDPNG